MFSGLGQAGSHIHGNDGCAFPFLACLRSLFPLDRQDLVFYSRALIVRLRGCSDQCFRVDDRLPRSNGSQMEFCPVCRQTGQSENSSPQYPSTIFGIEKSGIGMHSYHNIDSQDDMDRLLASIKGFHDSMTKEIHLTNRGYIQPDKSMVLSHRFDAQLLIQSQWEPFAVELLFIEIEDLRLAGPDEYWGASGTVETGVMPLDRSRISMSFDSRLKIVCGKLLYRIRASWLGKESFLKSEIPSPEVVPANAIQDNWRQCSACFDAWEAPVCDEFAYCQNCGRLTQLAIGGEV